MEQMCERTCQVTETGSTITAASVAAEAQQLATDAAALASQPPTTGGSTPPPAGPSLRDVQVTIDDGGNVRLSINGVEVFVQSA